MAGDEIPSRQAVGVGGFALGLQQVLAVGEEVQEVQLGGEVVRQLLLLLGQGQTEMSVEAHRLFHDLHLRASLQAAVERATGALGARIE